MLRGEHKRGSWQKRSSCDYAVNSTSISLSTGQKALMYYGVKYDLDVAIFNKLYLILWKSYRKNNQDQLGLARKIQGEK